MTMMDLIEKLRIESIRPENKGKCNGAYGVLDMWYKELLDPQSKTTKTEFDNIHGFLWGLRATFFITKEEHEQLNDDLTNNLYVTKR